MSATSTGELTQTTDDMDGAKSLNDHIMAQVGKDYAEYLNINVENERQQFDDSIEGMLTRLDDYLGLVSLIRSDTNLCLETTLPVIQDKSEKITKIFDRIDRLEAFVAMVRRNMDTTEENLNRAEAEIGSVNSIRKMISSISMPSFLSKNKPPRQTNPKSTQKKYTPPEIFKTSDFLHYAPEEQQASGSGSSRGGARREVAAKEIDIKTFNVDEIELDMDDDGVTWPSFGDGH